MHVLTPITMVDSLKLSAVNHGKHLALFGIFLINFLNLASFSATTPEVALQKTNLRIQNLFTLYRSLLQETQQVSVPSMFLMESTSPELPFSLEQQ